MAETLPAPRGIEMIAVYTTMAVLSTVAFALRAYVRSRLIERSWEDWAAGAGWFIYVFFCGSSMVGPFFGTGQHVRLVPPEKLPIALRQWYIGELTYVTANLAVKLSIALMLLRVTMEKYQRRLIYICTGITQIYSVVFLFIFIFQCNPIQLFWTKSSGATSGQCIDPTIIVITGYLYLAVTIIFDWTMAILPWFVVRNMQLDLRTRRMIAVVLALGSVASIATLVRIPYVITLANTHDFLYENINLAIWACVETGLSIIASSAATLKPLFRRTTSHRRPSGYQTPKLNTIEFVTDSSESNTDTTTKLCTSEINEI